MNHLDIKLADFDYTLPADLIAGEPASPRDTARLLDLTAGGLNDRRIADLPDVLRSGDLLVVNNTRVIPAQLKGRRGEARISITLNQRTAPNTWQCFVRPAKKLRLNDRVVFADGLAAEVVGLGVNGERELRFNLGGTAFDEALERFGTTPLPPYIPRPEGVKPQDKTDYQTIYARHPGAVAAPTAGLHFTPELLARLKAKGIAMAEITLHVGAGTFLPVKVADPRQHKMHSEWGEISAQSAQKINEARNNGGRIVAVGTTVTRLLESCWIAHGAITPYQTRTDLFIMPGFRFRVVDLLLTNFHLPKSTLLMLVSAFAGGEQIRQAYAHAIAQKYRFFSYGDACLLGRHDG